MNTSKCKKKISIDDARRVHVQHILFTEDDEEVIVSEEIMDEVALLHQKLKAEKEIERLENLSVPSLIKIQRDVIADVDALLAEIKEDGR